MMLSKKELRKFAKFIVKGLKKGELDPALLSELLRSAYLYEMIEPFLNKKDKERLLTLMKDQCDVIEIDQYQVRKNMSEECKASIALVKQQFSLLDMTIAKAKELVGSVAVEFGVHYSELYDLICVEKIEALLRWVNRGSLLLEDIEEYMTEVRLFK